ncbi:DUF262 domain-containing protein [Sphingorhabdus sp. Alg239-R122]|uniref:GmrSD restriction endonuclease domain-containing protein n=2 Tax=Sphingorhabdus sp. Alg239-R122 TaxID=2305989 RepID=UPI0013DCA34F|nr:DUF262 domain-containing protein [Sphingorhabdus sp. Alg239-R122]
MKATEASLLAFLKKSPQFVIPIYQRTYSWTEKECRQLWLDIIRAGTDNTISVHFIGSIVYIEDGLSQVSHQAPLLVIDGQQRLTTVTLLLAALAAAISEDEPIDGFSARKLRNYYLLNPEEEGERHFKLLLSQTDKDSLTSIVSQKELHSEKSVRVMENFELFQSLIAGMGNNLEKLCKGLAKLVVVDIALSRDQDNPQLIFESMNSTGRELSQADLIRNFILMGLEPGLQSSLYEQFWRPMELNFGQEAYNAHFDSFMRHYLTVKTGEIPRLQDVYDAFKGHARTPHVEAAGIEGLVKDIRIFAKYYCKMALKAETDPELKLAFDDLRELKVEVAYPFLMELYDDYTNEVLSKDELLETVRLIESYVFRRAICAIPTNSLNKTFATFTKSLKKDRYLESIKAHFLLLPSYRRFPSDEEFRRDIQTRDLYNFRSRSYWLRRFENHGRKERVPVNEYTIEHIMPQSENLSAKWKTDLGDDWERVHETYLHTLGNLTLTGYNSEYGDRPFQEKRDMKGGFKESPIRLNEGLGEADSWDENAITTRANKFASKVCDVWSAPTVNNDILEAYKPKKFNLTEYSIDDHHHLLSEPSKSLFEAFRREVESLDPCVSEEFLKLYVAYKAETNFVDVVPQAKQLRLSLNMKYSEIDDPREMCKDVSNLGRWGNGDVEVRLSSLEELPYVIGLVRQSLEQQLGSD